MIGKTRGGVSVAIGMASERDEALPIRAVKGSSMAAAEIVSDAVQQVNQIAIQTIERALEESNKDISQIIAETTVLQAIVGKVDAKSADDQCSATGTVSDAPPKVSASKIIELPPGAWMSRLAIVFSPKTRERVFDQIVADFREEYCDGLSRDVGRTELFFLVWRHWSGFVLAFIYEAWHGIAKLWKDLKGAG